jgi:hypothetical protein
MLTSTPIRFAMHRRLAPLALLSCALLACTPPASTSSATRSSPIREPVGAHDTVTIALFEEFSTPGLTAMVRRRSADSANVLIVIKQSALSIDLLSAVISAVPLSTRMRVPGSGAPSGRVDLQFWDKTPLKGAPAKDREFLERTIEQLRHAPPRDFPEFGMLPAITLGK